MSFNDIQNALNTHLDDIIGIPKIYWPNVNDDDSRPIQATSWIRPTLLPSRSATDTMSGSDYHQGIYQVDIYTELKKGTSPLLSIADLISDEFNKQNLVSNDTTVHIGTPSISTAQRDEGWWTCYVEVPYTCIT